jgi:hypothetical protein
VIDAVVTCWSCGKELQLEEEVCPACRHPQDQAPPVRQRFGRPGGPPSVIYLFVLPVVGFVLGDRWIFGPVAGALVGVAAWVGWYAEARGWIKEKS